MTDAFLRVLGLSFNASWLVLAVIVLRLFLRKAPKFMRVLLWGLVALRLLCPVTVESRLSLVPELPQLSTAQNTLAQGSQSSSAEQETPTEQIIPSNPERLPDVTVVERPSSGAVTDVQSQTPAAPEVDWNTFLSAVWCLGMEVLGVYAVGSYWRLYRRVRTAVRLRENIYRSEFAATPFVLGFLRPRIYLPTAVAEEDVPHVIAHEQAHISRRDHWWKPLGYILLTVHWFNPLMWVAYILLCRDIELACDEKVVKKLGVYERADYSQALLSCSVHQNMILACPVAFGTVGVKKRVKNVLNYRKPGLWISLVTVAALVISAVCFGTVQPAKAEENPEDPIVTVAPEDDVVVSNSGGTVTVVNSDGLEYTVQAIAVTPAGLRLIFRCDEPTQFQIDNDFWIDRQTENGWQTLEARVEDPVLMSGTVGYSAMIPTGYDWPVDWSGIYGILEPGTYRIRTSLYEGEAQCCVEFVIGDPGDSLKARALERCYAALEELLSRESYHVEEVEHLVEDPSVDPNASEMDRNDENRSEHLRSGNDYLLLQETYQTGVLNGGRMIRDGAEYWLVNKEYGDGRVPAHHWTLIPDNKAEVFFHWVQHYVWTVQEVRAVEMTEDSVTLTLKSSLTASRAASDVATFYFDGQGRLAQIVRVTEYGASGGNEAFTATNTLRVLDSTAAEIAARIEGQDVNGCYSFSWEQEQITVGGVVEREFVNTDKTVMDTVAQVIARADRERTVTYTDILVYHDETAGVWKVEFRNGYGKWITETVYLDDNGVTLLITYEMDLE